MKSKSTVYNLSEKLKWNNWPIWLKGFFLLWPSLGPAYLFITRTPSPTGGEAELNTIMTNLEYQNYFIVVFIGFWSINLILLGLTWAIGGLVSETYRSYLTERSKVSVKTTPKQQKAPVETKTLVRKYPVLVKKGTGKGTPGETKTVKAVYPVLKKKSSSAKATK